MELFTRNIILDADEFQQFVQHYSAHTLNRIMYSDDNFGIDINTLRNMCIFNIGVLKAGKYFNLNKPFVYFTLNELIERPMEMQVYSNSGPYDFT